MYSIEAPDKNLNWSNSENLLKEQRVIRKKL